MDEGDKDKERGLVLNRGTDSPPLRAICLTLLWFARHNQITSYYLRDTQPQTPVCDETSVSRVIWSLTMSKRASAFGSLRG